MKNLKRVKTLYEGAKSIKTIKERFVEKRRANNCDKDHYEWGYSYNDFISLKATVTLNVYIGYYGSSSCSALNVNMSGEDMNKYLNKAIEKHDILIRDTMAELMINDANELKQKAKEELEANMKLLNEIEQ